MKILVKWVLLVVVVLVGSSQLMASELGNFVGNYELNAGENADCPKKMDILQVASGDNHLVVFGNSQEPGYQRHYSKINSGKSKIRETWFIDDFEFQHKSVFNDGVLENAYRVCNGDFIKKCTGWYVINSVVAADEDYGQVVVSTRKQIFQQVADAAGFPAGVDCTYGKVGPNQVTKILR